MSPSSSMVYPRLNSIPHAVYAMRRLHLCSISAASCDYTKKKVPMLLLATFYDYLKEGHYDRSICPFQNRFCQELEVWIESCQLSTRLSKNLSKGSP